MTKVVFSIFILVLFAGKSRGQPLIVAIGNQYNSTITNPKNDFEVKPAPAAVSLVTIENSKITLVKKITFDAATVEFNESIIKADEIIFTATVTNITITGTVRLECRKITFPASTVNIKNTGKADLVMLSSQGQYGATSIALADNFTFRFTK